MVCLQTVDACFAPSIVISQEGHRVERAVELRPVGLRVVGYLLPEHGIACLPPASSTSPGFAYKHCLVRQQLLYLIRVNLCHIHAKHCIQLRISGTSRWVGIGSTPYGEVFAPPACALRLSASMLSLSSSAISTKSSLWIFATSLAGIGGIPSPSMNGGAVLLEPDNSGCIMVNQSSHCCCHQPLHKWVLSQTQVDSAFPPRHCHYLQRHRMTPLLARHPQVYEQIRHWPTTCENARVGPQLGN